MDNQEPQEENKMIQSEGQISLFDFWDSESKNFVLPKPELKECLNKDKLDAERHPLLMEIGQTCWTVCLGDVLQRKVLGTFKLNTNGGRGYWLTGDTTWNDRIGISVFLNRQEAEEKAADFRSKNDCILEGDIPKPIERHRFSYVRTVDERRMFFIWDILPGGKVLEKTDCTYLHIIDCKTENEAHQYVKKAMNTDWNFLNHQNEPWDGEIKLKNMYRCNEKSNWMYSEAGYMGCIGSGMRF